MRSARRRRRGRSAESARGWAPARSCELQYSKTAPHSYSELRVYYYAHVFSSYTRCDCDGPSPFKTHFPFFKSNTPVFLSFMSVVAS